MKKLQTPFYLLALLALSWLAIGCKSNDPALNPDALPYLNVKPTAGEELIPAAGKSYTLSLTSNTAWSVETKIEGLVISPTSGEAGTHSVTLTVPANTGVVARLVDVTFKIKSTKLLSQVWSGQQAGAALSIRLNPDKQEAEVPRLGGTYTVELTANSKWKANLSGSITVDPAFGEAGVHTVSITVLKNTTQFKQNRWLSFTTTGVVEEQTVVWQSTQESGAYIEAIPKGVYADVPGVGGSFTVEVLAEAGGWRLENTDPNLTITPTDWNEGPSVVTVTWAPRANYEVAERSSNLVFRSITLDAPFVEITTTQAAKIPAIGYVTQGEAIDGIAVPVGLMCVGRYGGWNRTAYGKSLFVDKRGAELVGVNLGNSDDGMQIWGPVVWTEAKSNYDGLLNTQQLNSADYLAAKYCLDKGMYLPAKDQLKQMRYQRPAVDLSTSFTFLDGTYWSSTQAAAAVAWCVVFQNGAEESLTQSTLYYVRCVQEY